MLEGAFWVTRVNHSGSLIGPYNSWWLVFPEAGGLKFFRFTKDRTIFKPARPCRLRWHFISTDERFRKAQSVQRSRLCCAIIIPFYIYLLAEKCTIVTSRLRTKMASLQFVLLQGRWARETPHVKNA
jgi:hypothetical protein